MSSTTLKDLRDDQRIYIQKLSNQILKPMCRYVLSNVFADDLASLSCRTSASTLMTWVRSRIYMGRILEGLMRLA